MNVSQELLLKYSQILVIWNQPVKSGKEGEPTI